MNLFRFVKKVFFTGLTILSSFSNAIPLSKAPLNTTRLNGVLILLVSLLNFIELYFNEQSRM